jgi:hypothetical protein
LVTLRINSANKAKTENLEVSRLNSSAETLFFHFAQNLYKVSDSIGITNKLNFMDPMGFDFVTLFQVKRKDPVLGL